MQNRMVKGDFVIIILVALCAVGVFIGCRFFFFSGGGTELEVKSDKGVEYYSLLANDSFTLKSNGYNMKVVIASGGVYVSECDCPDKVCVNTGKIIKAGESIVCVPAQISLTVIGDKGEYDIVGG